MRHRGTRHSVVRMTSSLPRRAWRIAGAITALALVPMAACADTNSDVSPTGVATSENSPAVANGYEFLNTAMDRCGSGETPRFPPSYLSGQPAADHPTVAYSYDVSLAIIAYLARGDAEDVARARILGTSILHVQQADPAQDGRVRNAYDCSLSVVSQGTSTGNQAWVGLALLRLYDVTHDAAYLAGSERLAQWIQANTSDARGAGGYTGGLNSDGSAITWKSTEHNLDVSAFFTGLSKADSDPQWATRASSASELVSAMWDKVGGRFWTGTGNDGDTANTDDPVPEDAQSWSWLVLQDDRYTAALDWANVALEVTDGTANGVKFADAPDSQNTVWFEGTAHMATALACRASGNDHAIASRYLATLDDASTQIPDPAMTSTVTTSAGIPAASRDGTSGGSDIIYDALHTGTTSWFLLAAFKVNPFTGVRCG